MIHCFWNIIIHCFWNIIIERNCNAQKMGVQWVHWESSSVLMKIDLAPPPGHRSGGRRSRTALIWLLHLRVTAQEGRGQIDLAPPPHLRGSLLHGDWEVEQPCFLVGNNQLTSPTPYTPYYYRPELVMGGASICKVRQPVDIVSTYDCVSFAIFCGGGIMYSMSLD